MRYDIIEETNLRSNFYIYICMYVCTYAVLYPRYQVVFNQFSTSRCCLKVCEFSSTPEISCICVRILWCCRNFVVISHDANRRWLSLFWGSAATQIHIERRLLRRRPSNFADDKRCWSLIIISTRGCLHLRVPPLFPPLASLPEAYVTELPKFCLLVYSTELTRPRPPGSPDVARKVKVPSRRRVGLFISHRTWTIFAANADIVRRNSPVGTFAYNFLVNCWENVGITASFANETYLWKSAPKTKTPLSIYGRC